MSLQETVLAKLRRTYPGLAQRAEKWPTKAIRLFCLDCMGGSAKCVNECEASSCPLHPFRFGTRHRRRGGDVVGYRSGRATAAESAAPLVQVPPDRLPGTTAVAPEKTAARECAVEG